MTKDQSINFAMYAADVGNHLAFSHKLIVSRIPSNWLRNKLFQQWNLATSTSSTADLIAEDLSVDRRAFDFATQSDEDRRMTAYEAANKKHPLPLSGEG